MHKHVRIIYPIFFLLCISFAVQCNQTETGSAQNNDSLTPEEQKAELQRQLEDIERESSPQAFSVENLNTQLEILEQTIETTLPDTEKALDFANIIVTQHPEDFRSYYWLGRAYMLEKEYEKAEDAFRKALQLDNTQPELYNHLGLVLKAKGLCDEAIGYFRKSAQLSGNPSHALFNAGSCYYDEGDYANAKLSYETAVKFAPNEYSPNMALAKTYMKLGDVEAAREVAEHCIDINPKDPEPYESMATILEQLDQPLKVTEYLAKSAFWDQNFKEVVNQLEKLPYLREDQELFQMYSGCLVRSGDDLLQAYETALEGQDLFPNSPEFWVTEIELHIQNRQLQKASERLSLAQEKFPSSSRLIAQRGNIAHAKGNYNEALTFYEAAIEQDPLDLPLREITANLYRELSKEEPADSLHSVMSHYHTGILFYYKHQYQQGKMAMARVKKDILPKSYHGTFEYYYGLILGKLGNVSDMENHLNLAIEADPNHADALTMLIQFYINGDEPGNACAVWNAIPDTTVKNKLRPELANISC
jgi:tetratricopeptide (TPR) repeat protein